MSSREVIHKLAKAGWVNVKTVGDHWQFKNPMVPGKVTVPHPRKDLHISIIISIEKQSGLRLRDAD